jgi:conjugal transfer pilus assembly protein TraE
MNREVFEKDIQSLRMQRVYLGLLCILLAVALSVGALFLFSKEERVIVVPPVVDKPFWVENNKVSVSYLEQFGTFLSGMVLSKTPSTAQAQRNSILKYTTANFYGALKQRLLEEEEKIKKQNASIVFFTTGVTPNLKNLEVYLEGERVFFVGDKKISTKKEKYRFSFSYEFGALRLSGVSYEDEVNS